MALQSSLTAVVAAAAAATILAACAEPDGVSQLGSDTYSVSDTFRHGEMADARNRAISQAGLYCDQQGRRLLVQEAAPGATNGHGAGSVRVTFRCLYRGDPELLRRK